MSQRRDARRNRARIVTAAAEVFREAGAAAPLDLVARRADVGRATLYRHFPDRGALIAAVLQTRVETLEEYAAEHPDAELLEQLLVEIYWFQRDVPGLVAAIRGTPTTRERLGDVVGRTRALLAAALETARDGGVVRPDTTLTDVFLVIAMTDGVLAAQSTSPVPIPTERGIELLLRSLRTEERSFLPVPAARLRITPPDSV